MIGERYTLETKHGAKAYTFYSEGKKGRIRKWIAILPIVDAPENYYELGFGDFIGDKLSDKVLSGNGDAIKVMNTIVYALRQFFYYHTSAIVLFEGVDERRQNFYNSIIQHKLREISPFFLIEGEIST